jgi:hypothetical protein
MESMNKWTPGPWKAGYGQFIEHNKVILAEVFTLHPVNQDYDFLPFQANQSLIAAAPELYEALDTLIRWAKIGNKDFEGVGDSHHMADEWVAARKALAKARGEQ